MVDENSMVANRPLEDLELETNSDLRQTLEDLSDDMAELEKEQGELALQITANFRKMDLLIDRKRAIEFYQHLRMGRNYPINFEFPEDDD